MRPSGAGAAFTTIATLLRVNSDTVPSAALKSNDEDLKVQDENSSTKTTIQLKPKDIRVDGRGFPSVYNGFNSQTHTTPLGL